MVAPRALKVGDVIGIAAPASGFDPDAFARGVAWLRARGFRVTYRRDIHARHHYLAGPRSRRLAELQELLRDSEVKAVLFARGGFGVMHLLPDLDVVGLRETPRIVLGYSDLTPLLNWITRRTGLITFHGPLVAGFHETSEASLAQMLDMLTGAGRIPAPLTCASASSGLRGGVATGRLCGGNLSLVAATLGTPYEIDTRGRILLLEEVGERPYRVDRLLTQLRLAGKLREAAGVAVGEMVDCVEPGGKGRPVVDIVREVCDDVPGPVVYGLPFGHGPENMTLPLGALAELDGDRGELRFQEPVVV